MIAIVLQARMGSSRLPGKSLLPLGGTTLVEQAMARLALVPVDELILATEPGSASALAPAAERLGWKLLVGDPEDVLARYCLAIRRYGIDIVVRATGDNPLVSHELAELLIRRRDERPSDYAGYLGMPLGMGVEVVAAQALLRAEAEASPGPAREHVCPYLYGHPELFMIDQPRAPAEYQMPEGRVTVDTSEDYEAMLRLYGQLYGGAPIPTAAVMTYLRGLSA